jgi:hypothetical protein
MIMPDPFAFSDDYWMMLGLFPEDTQEPTEDPPSSFPPGYDEADYYDDNERSQHD